MSPAALPPARAWVDARLRALEPVTDYPGTQKAWPARCLTCGKPGRPRYGRGGCARCAGLRRGQRRRSGPIVRLARMLAAGQIPTAPDPGLVTEVWPSRCMVAGHKGEPTVTNASRRGRACDRCGRAVTANKLALRTPVALSRARVALTEPLTAYQSGQSWILRCLGCGRTLSKHPHTVRDYLDGCGYCRDASSTSRRHRHARLPTDIAVARALMRAQEPLKPWIGSTLQGWLMRCLLCGVAAPKSLSHLKQGVGICAHCAQYGFDPEAPAEVYLVVNDKQGEGKFGIGGLENSSGRRVDRHERLGWRLYGSWQFELGRHAKRVEDLLRATLRKNLNVPPSRQPGTMPQSGETETFDLRLCPASTVWALMVKFARQVEREILPPQRQTLAERRRTRETRAQLEVLRAGAWPQLPYPGGASKPWPMRCFACGRSHPRRLAHLREGRPACPTCRRSVRIEATRLPVARAYARIRSGGVEPTGPRPNSTHQPWLGRCLTCGRSVEPRLVNISRGQGGCKPCSMGRYGVRTRLDHEVATARIRSRALEPLHHYSDNKTPWHTRCLICGAISKPLPANVFSDRAGCYGCERKRLAAQYRTPYTAAVAAMHAGGWEPLALYPGANAGWPSRCLFCGTRSRPTKSNLQQRGAPACRGGNRHRPGRPRNPR